MKILREIIKSNFSGTIIDIETIGDFLCQYQDSRQYMEITPVIFGFITGNKLVIYCAKKKSSIPRLKEISLKLLKELPRPFHAFNSNFEKGILYHNVGLEIDFERELQKEAFEPKWRAIKELNIPQYGDPFNDDGLHCMRAWEEGKIDDAMAHNRACLLKERDILLKRGHTKPESLTIFKD